MKKAIVIEHVVDEVESNFDDFTFHLETALGILMPATLGSLGAVPASMGCYLKSTSAENELTLFNMLLQDDLQKDAGQRKIKQYQIGCPHIMRRMIAHDAGTALYTPLHLLVYEKGNGKVVVEYDLPSSLFARFNNGSIWLDAIILESNLVKLIQKADEGNGYSQM